MMSMGAALSSRPTFETPGESLPLWFLLGEPRCGGLLGKVVAEPAAHKAQILGKPVVAKLPVQRQGGVSVVLTWWLRVPVVAHLSSLFLGLLTQN